MSELGLSLEELSRQPLELFAREGAELVLTVALEEEVTDFLMRRPYERSQGSPRRFSLNGNIRGYRNGHRERQVSCGAGEIELAVPRVSDTKEDFHYQLLEAYSGSGLGSLFGSFFSLRESFRLATADPMVT